jgi:hypothetical protein
MADIIYTVNQDLPENIVGFEQYSQEDRALVDSFQINNTFSPTKDYSELHILSLSDELLESIYDFNNYKQSPAAQSAGQEGTSAITIDPIEDCKFYGYGDGGVKLLYHFLNDLYSQDRSRVEFFIQDISADRTELSLSSLNIPSEELVRITSIIKGNLQSQSYFTGFRLNFQQNDLFIGINIDTLDSPTGTTVVVKLYEPLPDIYGIKSTLNIVDVVSDSLTYEIGAEIITPPNAAPTLRSPNFNIDLVDDSVIPTKYYNYDELLSYPVNNTNSQIYSAVSEKSIDISIDHSDFNNFVHFSSAQERLLNFKYKLDLLTSYSASIAAGSSATTGLQGISGSREYYQNLMTGVVSNFDHYERFLYYESGSSSWPKVNNTKPYTNEQTYLPGTLTPNPAVSTWYSNEIANAISYDNTNYNSLAYSIPTYLRDDANNENYLTFIYMIGQHFDNLWLYSKAVTDKYDADNRLDKGISKDLVAEALKNFGVKLYTSNKSVEDLFSTFIGQAYQSGSEDINNYITGSLTGSNTPIQPYSVDNYQKEVYKRIYHNLPLLLKSKGTERGLRALINCFGIPSDIFDIKVYGGRNVNERPFYGDYRYYTSSLDKVRLDNTGSIVAGNTLSQYTSVVKREYKYTDDLHSIELGFSPTDNVDKYIESQQSCTRYRLVNYSADPTYYSYVDCGGTLVSNQELVGDDTVFINATAGTVNTGSYSAITTTTDTAPTPFNIDDYLGDPRNLYSDNYNTFTPAGSISGSLVQLTDQIMSGSDAYNVQDFVRLIKFFDNTIFKMVKDFIPARSTAATGIIIKPHLLGRSKAKSVILSGSRPEITGSIDTAFIEGGNGGAFISRTQGIVSGELNTSYTKRVQTPFGVGIVSSSAYQQPSFDGELRNSSIRVTNGELNRANFFKVPTFFGNNFDINRWLNLEGLCILAPYSSYTDVNGGIYYSGSNNTLYLDSGSWSSNAIFTGLSQVSMVYEITSSNIPTSSFQFPFNTDNYANYTTHSLTASNTGVEDICTSSVNIQVAVCDVDTTSNFRASVKNTDEYNITSWFVTGSQNLSSNMNLTIVNNDGTPPIYNNLLANATASTFPGLSTDTYTLTVQDTKIPLTCTYTYPISAGICSVISRQITLLDRNSYWNLGVNMGTTLIGQLAGPSTLTPYNYGLAAYFTGVNPNELAYRVQIGTRFGGILVDEPVTPPVGNNFYSSGGGTFFPTIGYNFNMFRYDWQYGPVTNPGGNHPPIQGNVALFKISYSTEFLAAFPQSFIDSQDVFFQRVDVKIIANELPPDCTPYVILIPPPQPSDEADDLDPCCFIGSTLITLPDYRQVRIDSLSKGDEVLSYNEETGEVLVSKVITFSSPTKKDIVKFILSNGTELEAARNHPLWVIGKGWSSYAPDITMRDHKLEVAQLSEGDMLLTQEGLEVELLTMYLDEDREYEVVYNIGLDNHYTYYANGILAHNKTTPQTGQNYCTDADDGNYDSNLGGLV